MTDKIPDAFAEFVQDVVDDEIAAFRVRVESGAEPLIAETVLHVVGQLIGDRAKMRGLVERIRSTVQ